MRTIIVEALDMYGAGTWWAKGAGWSDIIVSIDTDPERGVL